MNVFIRTDSSKYMGSGHVMRCLTLADGLKERGEQVEFICRDLPGNLSGLIEERGYKVHLLAFDAEDYKQENYTDEYAFWLAVPWEQDVQETLSAIKGTCNLLIVDHYGLDYQWQSHSREKAEKVMVIDDLASRQHDCDYLLDHNFYVGADERYQSLVPEQCVQFVGPKYALIRPEILKARAWREQYYSFPSKEHFNCLVFMGGSDTPNYTQKVVEQLLKLTHVVKITVVLGAANPNIQILEAQYAEETKVVLIVQPQDYYQLLAQADFVVGAGGVSTLERFCIGVPQYVFQIADNQKAVCKNLQYTSGAEFIGDITKKRGTLCLGCFHEISIAGLKKMSGGGRLLVDGKGVERVKEALWN